MKELKKHIKAGSIVDVKQYLENNIDRLTLNEALVYACSKKQLDIVQLLLSNGADIHYNSESPLEKAVQSSDKEFVKLILSLGADPRLVTEYFLFTCLQSCSGSILEYLMESGMDINERMLETLVTYDNLDAFVMLHNQMPDVNLSKLWSIACESGAMHIIKYMLDLPLEFDLTNKHLIAHVVLNNETKLFKKILNQIPNPESIVDYDILKNACIVSNYEMVKIILELGVDPNDQMDKNKRKMEYYLRRTALECALQSNKPSYGVVRLLLDYDANVTNICLIHSILCGWDIFHLIYQSNQWCETQLSSALRRTIEYVVCCFGIDDGEKIWRFLQKEVNFQLRNEDLKEIICYCINNCNFAVFEHFANFYGKDTILDLISFKHIYYLLKINNRKPFEYLLKFYGKETVFGLIDFSDGDEKQYLKKFD